MTKCNVIGIDLAKSCIQVCIVNRHQQVISNKPLRRDRLASFLVKQPQSLVAFEACGRAQYWARKAIELGHRAVIIPPPQVKPYRQGHKTDANDALAIAIASQQPKLKTAGIKTVEQQCLQSDMRVHKHASDQLTATGNLLRGLVAEFGIEIRKGIAGLREQMPWILEDAENELPLSVRESLHLAWQQWLKQERLVAKLDTLLQQRVRTHHACARLTQLESVGTKNALGLYTALGDGKQFHNGREAAACIGLTPKQHSSGGRDRIGHIGKFKGNQPLRSALILGAFSVVSKLDKRQPRNHKECWLKELINRRGQGRAAVALANKTVRTAWAMCRYHEPYRHPATA